MGAGKRIYRLLPAALLAVTIAPFPAASADEDLAPHKMLQSLQFVQDSVVLGDHSAAEMQRFLLETMDKRLRSADASVFDNPRNVDAAFIYAMSGGNPATLEYLVSKDIGGDFDSRVSDVLRKYLSGKGALVAKAIAEMVPEYKDRKIGPYLALVAGNISLTNDTTAALKFYDWARLSAPGTIVEEAALRRSLSIAVEEHRHDLALRYSTQYVRRFLHSPYASQFADLFVQMVVDGYGPISQEDIDDAAGFMDPARRKEIYLRIARKAAIAGKGELARISARKAHDLANAPDEQAATPGALANLYGGMADIPTADITIALQSIIDIPEDTLSDRDRALRTAAKTIAEQVLRKPVSASPAQAVGRTVSAVDMAMPVDEGSGPAGTAAKAAPGNASDMDPSFKQFVETGRSKLDEIDALLKKESTSR